MKGKTTVIELDSLWVCVKVIAKKKLAHVQYTTEKKEKKEGEEIMIKKQKGTIEYMAAFL